jgi:hypothetical protein
MSDLLLIDGHTAALRAHSAAEARAESLHDAYYDKAVDAIVEDVIYGNGVKVGYPPRPYSARDVIEDKGVDMWLDSEDLANLATAPLDSLLDIQLKMEKQLEKAVREWCDTETGRQVVADRIQEMAEDAEEV